ncbi:hypothetical protein BGX34_002269 [Mortierella sp. NVP85]|nr:hypothetical protein BGX34_002269 [Mortierella sp. NVP85]
MARKVMTARAESLKQEEEKGAAAKEEAKPTEKKRSQELEKPVADGSEKQKVVYEQKKRGNRGHPGKTVPEKNAPSRLDRSFDRAARRLDHHRERDPSLTFDPLSKNAPANGGKQAKQELSYEEDSDSDQETSTAKADASANERRKAGIAVAMAARSKDFLPAYLLYSRTHNMGYLPYEPLFRDNLMIFKVETDDFPALSS